MNYSFALLKSATNGADRPKLKDFLPFMKPNSGARTTNKPRSSGPPQIDRNLTNFTSNQSLSANNTGVPIMPQYNMRPEVPPQQPQQQPIFQNQMSNHIQRPAMPQQSPINNQFAIQPPVNPAMQMSVPHPNQALLAQQQQHQQLQLVEQQRLKREFDEQAAFKLNQQKLLEQQIKERELQLKKQQLEQQEQQLKLQQQQMQLQQQQQQFMLMQQQQQQQQKQQQQQQQLQNWVKILF